MSPRPSDDKEDAKYTMVIHSLCKMYDIKDPLDRHVFSILENMSRGNKVCAYLPKRFAEYSGGSELQIETIIQRLKDDGIITEGKWGHTNGWKLTDDVRESAEWFKKAIKKKP